MEELQKDVYFCLTNNLEIEILLLLNISKAVNWDSERGRISFIVKALCCFWHVSQAPELSHNIGPERQTKRGERNGPSQKKNKYFQKYAALTDASKDLKNCAQEWRHSLDNDNHTCLCYINCSNPFEWLNLPLRLGLCRWHSGVVLKYKLWIVCQ